MNDLGDSFQAFRDGAAAEVRLDTLPGDLESLEFSVPGIAQRTNKSRLDHPPQFELGADGTLNDAGGAQVTHVKLAHLFKTTSSQDTLPQVEAQLKRLEDPGASEQATVTREQEVQSIAATYHRRTLVHKSFIALRRNTLTTKSKLQTKLKALSAKEHYNATLLRRAFHGLESSTTFSQEEPPTKPVAPMLIIEDQEAPIAIHHQQAKSADMLSCTETQTNVSAPVFKSDCSSPFNRLATILTDKPLSPTSTDQTRVVSGRDGWLSPVERSTHRLEHQGRSLKERQLKRRVLRSLELL